jgi:hypothetical protein
VRPEGLGKLKISPRAVVPLLISRSLLSNGSTSHNIKYNDNQLCVLSFF